MTELAPAQSSATTHPQSPVPLDTIPISPDGGSGGADGSIRPYPDDHPVTVFHDPDNFNVKHPLMNPWTLWFTKPPSGKV